MDNEQQPAASQYPHFPISDTGIARLHQELGRHIHLSIEQAINLEKLGPEYQQLQQTSLTFAEQHAPGKCQPTVAEVLGVPDDAVTLVPEPTDIPRHRRAGTG